MEPTGQAIRKILGEAVHLIRFPTILPEDFVDLVVPSGILTDKEALGVHQYFYRRTSSVDDFKFLKTYRAGIIATAKLHECCCQVKESTGFSFETGSTMLFGSPYPASALPTSKPAEKLDIIVEPRSVHLAGVLITTGSPAKIWAASSAR